MPARPTSSRLPALGAILGFALVRLVTRRGGTPAHHGPARAEPHAEEPERKPSNSAPSSHEASREPGRGREATSPTEIPPGAGRTSSGASTRRSTNDHPGSSQSAVGGHRQLGAGLGEDG